MFSTADEILKAYESALEAYRTGRLREALEKQQVLLEYASEWPKLHLLEAYIYRSMHRYVSEVRTLRHLLNMTEGKPEQDGLEAEAWSMLGSALLNLGRSREAVGALLRSADREKECSRKSVEFSNAIFAANSAADFTAEEFAALYEGYRELFSDVIPYPRIQYHHQRIRVGYLSGDLCNHPVAHFLWPLLHGCDRDSFSVYCYAANEAEDAITEKMQREVQYWRRVNHLPPEEIAAMIRADEIDILVELNGHTKNTCLPVLAWKPAPVQISGIGYMNSTGLPQTGYFLSDAVCNGEGSRNGDFFTEKMLVLPHSHFCFAALGAYPAPGPAPCRKKGYVTFGCFNNFSKVTDEMLRLWGKVLQKVPESRMILKHRIFNSEEGRHCTEERLRALGLPGDRVKLRGFSADYLEEYRDLDIALDTYPYTGGMTTCEALYMGVPVISLYGNRHGTRFGKSLLENAGLGELAVASPEDYVDLAAELAQDTELLSRMHEELREQMERSFLMNEAAYVREAEKAYRNCLDLCYTVRSQQ